MRQVRCRIQSFALGVVTVLCCQAVLAQGDAPRIANVHIGFNGYFKVGVWTPVEFDIIGASGESVQPFVRTADPDGNPVLFPFPEATLPEDGIAHVSGIILPGRLESPVDLELRQNENVVDTVAARSVADAALTPMKQSSQMWVIAGDQPAFEKAANRWNSLIPGDLAAIATSDLQSTLRSSEGMDAINLIVVPPSTSVSTETSEALRQWVQRGGHLVVPVGSGVAALKENPLSDWLPIRPSGQIDVRNLAGLNGAIPGSATLRVLGSLPAVELEASEGDVLAQGLGGPLILRAAYGIGEVTVLAVALDAPQLARWHTESQTDLAALLANVVPPWNDDFPSALVADSGTDLNPTGVSDLQTQLAHALDHYDNVHRTSYWGVIGWIVLLVVLVGPVDYLVLHRLLQRPQWTWVSLPIWIGLASVWAVREADTANNRPLQGRQLEITDLDVSANLVRVKSWLNFYSPKTQRVRIAPHPDGEFLPHKGEPGGHLRTGWMNRPETGFRGTYRQGGMDSGKPEYTISTDRRAIENLPTQVWSTGAVACEWESTVPASHFVEADLKDTGLNRVTGTITHHLSSELTDWFLAYGSFAYFPRRQESLPPGTSWDLSTARSNILRGVLIGLTKTSISRDTGREADTFVSRDIYDPLSRDPFMLTRMISFHKAAGGTDHTGLLNQSLESMDLSHLLSLNRAVLYGRLKTPTTEFDVNGTSIPLKDRETFIRIIIPVEKIIRSSDAPPDPSLLKPKD